MTQNILKTTEKIENNDRSNRVFSPPVNWGKVADILENRNSIFYSSIDKEIIEWGESFSFYVKNSSWDILASLSISQNQENSFVRDVNWKAIWVKKRKIWFIDKVKRWSKSTWWHVKAMINTIIQIAKESKIDSLKLVALANPHRTKWSTLTQSELIKFYNSFWFKTLWNSLTMELFFEDSELFVSYPPSTEQ